MSIVLAHRLRGFHALLEIALREERARQSPDDLALAGIKKKKLAIKDQLATFEGRTVPSASH